MFNNNFGEVKGMASIVVLSFLVLLVISLVVCHGLIFGLAP